MLDTLVYVKHHTSVWLEITTLLIPGHNDSDAELSAMCSWILDNLGDDVPLHFSAFHPDYKMRDIPATPASTLLRARTIAKSLGLHHVYTGNVHDAVGGSSYCHACDALLIERDWYRLGRWALSDDGRCLACGARFAGVVEAKPGNWGPRRLPLTMGA